MAAGYSDGALIVDTGLNNAGFFRDARQYKAAVQSLKNTVNRVGQDMAKSGNAYAQSIQRSIKANNEFKAELKRLEDEAEALKSILENPARSVENDIKKLETEMSKVKKVMDSMTGPGAKMDLDAWDAARKEVASLTEQMETLEKRRAELSNPRYRYSTEYMNMANQYNAVAAKIEQMRAVADEAGGGFRIIARNALTAAGTLAKMVGHGVLGFLKKLARGAKNAAIQLAKLSGKALASGIKAIGSAASKAGKALFGLGKRTKQTGGGLQLSLRNILKYGLGIRSLFVLFNRLRSAITEGFNTLANYDPRVKSALASLKGALNGLKGSLAGAFQPILTAIAPALTTFINLLATAINHVGMFMAALTGQGYYMAAKGIGAVDSAASGASGSVKELNRQLAGFDELNVLSAGSSGGGGGGSGADYSYDKIPLDSGIADFVQRIKQLFAAGQYEEIGAVIADGINGAFQTVQDFIKWDNIGQTVTMYVDAVAGMFNGLVDRINWRNIGATFGEGLNTITNTLGRWFEKLNLAKLGKSIGEALNGMVAKVDFGKAGRTLASMLTAKLVVVGNMLATFDWEKFGPKLAEGFNSFVKRLDEVIGSIDWPGMARKMVRGLNGFIRHVDWRDLGDTIAKRTEALIDMLKTALTEFKWGDAATKFATAVNAFFRREELWTAAGQTIKAAIRGLLDFTKNFIVTFDAVTAAKRVRAALAEIDWPGVAREFWDTAKLAFAKAGDFLEVLLGGSSTNRIVTNASDIYSEVLTKSGNKSVAYQLGKKIGGILGSIPWGDIVKELGKTIGEAFTGLWDGLFNSEHGSVAIALGTALLGIETIFSQKINLLGNLLQTGLSGLLSKMGLFGALVSLVGGAGVWTGTKLYNLFKANGGEAIIQETGKALTGAVTEYMENHELPDGKTYNTGDPVADLLTYLSPGGTKALDKRQNEYDRAKNDPFSEANATKWGTISEQQLWWNGRDYQSSTEALREAIQDNTEGQVSWGEAWKKAWDEGRPLSKHEELALSLGVDPNNLGGSVSVGVNFHPEGETKPAYFGAGLLKYLKAVFAPGTDAETRVELIRYGWETVSAWVNSLQGRTKVEQAVGLIKTTWQTVSAWVNALKGNIKVEQAVGLIKAAWSTVSAWVNTLKGNTKVQQSVDLVKGWIGSVTAYLGLSNPNPEGQVDMDLRKGWYGDPVRALGLDDLSAQIKMELKASTKTVEVSGGGGKWSLQTKALGGVVTAGGVSRAFANGGMVSAGGRARWWNGIPKYAGGTSRAHGTLFAAGEAGPEIVGHIGGRTEVLNQSQLAQTMRGAVTGGMVAALRGIEFRMPAMATGSVVPYEVSAQIEKSAARLQSTLDANNEDLIRTIISVIGAQTTAIVAALQAQQRQGAGAGGMSVQQVINEINRRTQMFSASPLI